MQFASPGPPVPASARPNQSPPSRRPPTADLNRRILIVDDNPDIHRDFQRILGQVGRGPDVRKLDALEDQLFGSPATTTPPLRLDFDLASAHQGCEAVRMVDEAVSEGRPFSMVFQDMRMPPGMDGLETVEKIWSKHPETEIVFCTAYSDHSWEEIVGRLGLNDHILILKKPFDVIEVQQIALSVTTKWNLARQAERYIVDLERAVSDRTLQLEREMKERERLQAELFRAQKLESIGQLASGIAHEINTPIQYVATNAEFLQEAFQDLRGMLEQAKAATEDSAHYDLEKFQQAAENADLDFLLEEIPRALNQAREGVGRVAKIVRAMREFSHPGSKEMIDADINEALRSTIVVAQNEWKHVAEVITHLDPQLPLVNCVIAEINQALLNIIVNAAHAIASRNENGSRRNKGRIEITTQSSDDHVEILVADTGTGIAAEIADRVFDPFFTTKQVGKGTGQGLSVAYSIIVDAHRGQVDFDSVEGRGTVFRVRLPIRGQRRSNRPRLVTARS